MCELPANCQLKSFFDRSSCQRPLLRSWHLWRRMPDARLAINPAAIDDLVFAVNGRSLEGMVLAPSQAVGWFMPPGTVHAP